MLRHRAAKLLAHVTDTLQWAGLSSTMGVDYATVLRSNLLATTSYCAATPRDTFQSEKILSAAAVNSTARILSPIDMGSACIDQHFA